MTELFVYGTLMCEDIVSTVAGFLPRSGQAVLPGYRRFGIKNELYPAIKAEAGGRVEGVVYYGLRDESWRRLDRFEGEMYMRTPVVVFLEQGATMAVHAYVIRPDYEHLLTAEEWCYSRFLQKAKNDFIGGYSGYGALD